MYIIEKSDGTEAARWNNLTNPTWPDGGSQSGRSKVGDSRIGEDGETYTIFEVLQKRSGDGPRTLGTGPVTKAGDEWHQTTTYGPALPPPPDPQGTDDQAPGYDPDYATNLSEHRRKLYNELGATTEVMAVASWESLMQGTPNHGERDRIQAIRQEVKTRLPKP